jgi:precorrin-6B methylase 2
MSSYSAEAHLYDHTVQLLNIHESLLKDKNRNRPFYRALKENITRDSSVIDIGSGTGLWAIAAARMGAKRVVAIEQEPLLIGLIKTLAHENGVADKVEVIQGISKEVQLGREFDIIISETIGHVIFDEQIVPIMIDARERFLKPGGVLIPDTVTLLAAAAHLKRRHKKLPAGIPAKYGYFESLILNVPVGLSNKSPLKTISEPCELIRVDLASIEFPPNLDNLTAHWKLADTTHVNCFAVWAEATLTKGIGVTTMQTPSWSVTAYRIRPFEEKVGEIEFSLTLTTNTNRWSATLSNGQHQEAQTYSPAFAATELLMKARTNADVFSQVKRMGLIRP